MTEQEEIALIALARTVDPHFEDLTEAFGAAHPTIYQQARQAIATYTRRLEEATPPPTRNPTTVRALPTFDPRIWSAADERGQVHEIARRSYRDLAEWLRVTLTGVVLSNRDLFTDTYDYFGLTHRYEAAPDALLPAYRWVAVYAVTGGSEGVYIHVDLIVDNNGPDLDLVRVFTIKTFSSMDVAYEMARILAHLLDA